MEDLIDIQNPVLIYLPIYVVWKKKEYRTHEYQVIDLAFFVLSEGL